MQETAPNPYSTPLPWDLVAGGYAETTMEMLGEYAKEAFPLAGLSPNARVLDVACGPGTVALLVAPQVKSVEAIDFSAAMIEQLRAAIERRDLNNINAVQGDGQSLPYSDGEFDVGFSMFGLMFFPDRIKGFSEMHRTLKPGGRVLVTSWGPLSHSPLMQILYDAVREITGESEPDRKAATTLEDPNVFKNEMERAGFRNVTVRAVTKHLPVKSVESFWERMMKGGAPLVMLRKKIGDKAWPEKEQRALQMVRKQLTFPTTLSSNAWLGVGTK